MNDRQRFTLDSNVLVYAADGHAGARQAAAIKIIASVVISEDMAAGAEFQGVRIVAAFTADGRISAHAEALLPAIAPD